MLFNHEMVAKRAFYEEATCIPLIISGKPVVSKRGTVEKKLGQMADLMPTLLDLCGLPIPKTVEGISLVSEKEHPYIYGEVNENEKAARMIRWKQYKLIYYPCGNIRQLFDLEKDPKETHNCAADLAYQETRKTMEQMLIENLYGNDLAWIKDGELTGFVPGEYHSKADYGLYNQRGYHWPTPGGYSNQGNNA